MIRKVVSGRQGRTLDGVLRVVARGVPQYQAHLLTHRVRQKDCHRPTCRLEHRRPVCWFVGRDGKRLRRPEGQQVVHQDEHYGNRVSDTPRALLAHTGRPRWK